MWHSHLGLRGVMSSLMGKSYSGDLAYKVPVFDRPADYLAALFYGGTILAHTLICMWLFSQMRTNAYIVKLLTPFFTIYLVFDTLLTVYFYTDSPPVVNALEEALGSIISLYHLLIHCEVLKKFVSLGKLITAKQIYYIQIASGFWYLIGALGMNAKLYYIGSPMPPLFKTWVTFMSPLYFAVNFLVLFVESIYLMYVTWGTHVKIQKDVAELRKQQSEETDHFLFFRIIYTIEILCGILWAVLFYVGSKLYAQESPNMTIVSFGFSNVSGINTFIIILKLRSIKLESSTNWTTSHYG
ncbi:hypothetical protein EDD86DRAFT_259233 [Gorgonomyces haynaldii]|nr:hypothetical protein EDD86DRAFT_259233 [Gorgonomyces haynaldii]